MALVSGRFLLQVGYIVGNTSVGLYYLCLSVEAGALSYELGLQFVVARAKILSPHPDCPAGMAAVAANAVTISNYIYKLQLMDRVEISVFSSANNHVISGDLDAIGILVSHVKETGIRATLLNVDQGHRKRNRIWIIFSS